MSRCRRSAPGATEGGYAYSVASLFSLICFCQVAPPYTRLKRVTGTYLRAGSSAHAHGPMAVPASDETFFKAHMRFLVWGLLVLALLAWAFALTLALWPRQPA